MNHPTPHYLLRSQASQMPGQGHWRFVLRSVDGSAEIAAADVEPDVWGERLALLTIVRALEALDQPSRVTLVGCTRYIEQGIQYGMSEWKENGWRWEWFGQMVPVRDADLWQRMDQALQFHAVDYEQRQFDAPHGLLQGPHWNQEPACDKTALDSHLGLSWVKYNVLAIAALCGLWMQRLVASRRPLNQGLGARG